MMIVLVKGEIIKDLVEGKRMKTNKDDCTYMKEQRQVYLFVQLGLRKFRKFTKKSMKPLMRPALRQIVV